MLRYHWTTHRLAGHGIPEAWKQEAWVVTDLTDGTNSIPTAQSFGGEDLHGCHCNYCMDVIATTVWMSLGVPMHYVHAWYYCAHDSHTRTHAGANGGEVRKSFHGLLESKRGGGREWIETKHVAWVRVTHQVLPLYHDPDTACDPHT